MVGETKIELLQATHAESPIAKFIDHYILHLGFLDGKAGYSISKISRFQHETINLQLCFFLNSSQYGIQARVSPSALLSIAMYTLSFSNDKCSTRIKTSFSKTSKKVVCC